MCANYVLRFGFAGSAPESLSFRSPFRARRAFAALVARPRLRFAELSSLCGDGLSGAYSNFDN